MRVSVHQPAIRAFCLLRGEAMGCYNLGLSACFARD
jgi:hypothetical protein